MVAVTTPPPLFFLSSLTQLYNLPHLTLPDPGSFPGSPLTLPPPPPPDFVKTSFLLTREASLTSASCHLPLATLKSHPLIKCSAHLACHSPALGAMTGGQAFLLHQ